MHQTRPGTIPLITSFTPERLGPRRALMATMVAGIALALVALCWHVLAAGGWSVWEALLFPCFALSAPWLGLYASTALLGLALRLGTPDPAAAVLPVLRDRAAVDASPIRSRTAIAVCVRLEDMRAVLPPLGRLLEGLLALPGGAGHFALAILSDTPDGPAAAAEAVAASRLAARFPPGAVLYRRRAENTGYKAGNVMEFFEGAGRGFDHALVLDADSTMSPATVRRLVQVMQADPAIAILQPSVDGLGAQTDFARLFGFAHRHGARIWSTGQAWWQGPDGPFWGHNALIRIAPFRAHARLPLLPGGTHVLSHDLVEAALLHGAGWAVRVLPEDDGSHERHPPDLPAAFGRDLRWAAGNLQYRHLLRQPRLSRLGRLQLLQAILYYALAPFWFLMLPLAALNVASGGAEGTPRGALVALLGFGFLALNLPKLAGYLEVLLRPGRAPRAALLNRMGREFGLGLALDMLATLERTITLAWLALRGRGGWAPQPRTARGLSWEAAWRRFGAHTAVGLAMALLFASGGGFALAAALPVLAGLILAVPLAVATARPLAPRRAPQRLRPGAEAVRPTDLAAE